MRPIVSSALRLTKSPAVSPAIFSANRFTQPKLFSNTAFRMADKGASGKVHSLDSNDEYKSFVTSSKGVVVLDAFADWCGPCKVVAPQVDKLATQYSDVKFYKFDIDNLPDVAQELAVSSIPNFKIFKDGELVNEVVGAKPAAIEAAIKKASE